MLIEKFFWVYIRTYNSKNNFLIGCSFGHTWYFLSSPWRKSNEYIGKKSFSNLKLLLILCFSSSSQRDHHLVQLSDDNFCNPNKTYSFPKDSILIVGGGNCTYTDKAKLAKQNGASAIVIVDSVMVSNYCFYYNTEQL